MLFALLFIFEGLTAQTSPFPPPREIRVYNIQALNFGNFYTGNMGGNITIEPSGVRYAGGSVVLAGGLSHQAIFIVELLPGRIVNITYDQTVILYRVGGGGSMTMLLGPTDRGNSGDSFITSSGQPFQNPVNVGGILQTGNPSANPAGDYTGQFFITFNQE